MHRLTYRVYGTASSGNCHKVRLALDLLHMQYRWHEVDILKGETRTPQFLAMNPNGKVPLLQIDTDAYLPESNAILCYLADGTHLWQGDRVRRAQVLQWLFFEQYSHEPYIAVARFVRGYLGKHDDPRLPELMRRGNAALDVMEQHLAGRDWFVGASLSIADIALYAYTCRADEGGFDLARTPRVGAWLARMEGTAGVTRTPPAPGAAA
ncbi:MAG: glutathione S-transferase family protein [Betaproteobacteria bacterium]|jgi:glutathione S-transferase